MDLQSDCEFKAFEMAERKEQNQGYGFSVWDNVGLHKHNAL